MKILIVLYYYHPYVSGLSLLAKAQAEGLSRRGHTVTVLTLHHQAESPEYEVLNGVHVVRTKVLARIGKGGISWDFLRKIIALSKTHDIVNPHLPMAHFGLVVPFIDKQKLVPQYHCDLNLGAGLVSRLLQRFSYWSMGRVLARSSRIIATSLDYFSNCHFSKYTSSVRQIYPPIDQDRFGLRDAGKLKARLDIDGRPKLIGFVGRIVAEKGLEYLIRAIPFLEKKYDDFLILIAGDYENVAGGSVKGEIDSLLSRFPDRVRLTGYLNFDDLIAFYNLIDVLVLPSVDPLEAFGMVQVEAMLCGTPVVASDMPGVREVIRKTGYGRLARVRDPQDIAAKVIDVLDDPISIDRSQLAVFDFDHSIGEYEKLFSEMID